MPAIEVSCPICNGENIIEMNYRKPIEGDITEIFKAVIEDRMKEYLFSGEKYCTHCGKNIEVMVNVMGYVNMDKGRYIPGMYTHIQKK